MTREERLAELSLDLDVTEMHFRHAKTKEVKQALNNLRELLIIASHDLTYKYEEGEEHEYEVNN